MSWLRVGVAVAAGVVAAAGVAMATCGDCHTPRDKQGRMDQAHALQGTRLVFAPAVPIPDWADTAPPIAGGPVGWSHADLVKFLETGMMPRGRTPRPPMPPFRFNHEDAEAVAAYITSLPPAEGPVSASMRR